jgi:hypothetical protein
MRRRRNYKSGNKYPKHKCSPLGGTDAVFALLQRETGCSICSKLWYTCPGSLNGNVFIIHKRQGLFQYLEKKEKAIVSISQNTGFGILGLGVIAEFHVKAIKEITGCCFAAGFDPVPGRAAAFCEKHGGRPYEDLQSFLADKDIDIVTIATPSGLHLDGAVAAIRAGKNVIVEKPLEITTARCDRIIAEAKTHGVKAGTVFPSRYHAPSRIIKKAIDEGRFGKIVLADAQIKWYRTQEYYDSGKWRGTWQFDGGGALMN